MADEINGSSEVETSVTGDAELLNLVSLLATLLGVEDAASNPANVFAESIKKIASACGDTGNIQKYISALQNLKEQLGKSNNDRFGDVGLALNSATTKPNTNVMNNYNKFLELKHQQESPAIELNNFFNTNKIPHKDNKDLVTNETLPKTKSGQINFYEDKIRSKSESIVNNYESFFKDELNNTSLTDSEKKSIEKWITEFSNSIRSEVETQIKKSTSLDGVSFSQRKKISNLKNLNSNLESQFLEGSIKHDAISDFTQQLLNTDLKRRQNSRINSIEQQRISENFRRNEEEADSIRYRLYWENKANKSHPLVTDEERYNNWLRDFGHSSSQRIQNTTPSLNDSFSTFFNNQKLKFDNFIDKIKDFLPSKNSQIENTNNRERDKLAEAIKKYTRLLDDGAKSLSEANKRLEQVKDSRNKIFETMAEKSKNQGFDKFNVQDSITQVRKILNSQEIGNILNNLSNSSNPKEKNTAQSLRYRLSHSETLISQIEDPSLLQNFLNNSSDSEKLKGFYNNLGKNDKTLLERDSRKLQQVFQLIDNGINGLINSSVQSGKGLDSETQKIIQSLRNFTLSLKNFSQEIPLADKNLRDATNDVSRLETSNRRNQQFLNSAIRAKNRRDGQFSFIGGVENGLTETLSRQASSYLNRGGIWGALLNGFNNMTGNTSFSHIGGEQVSVDTGERDEHDNAIMSTRWTGGFSGTALAAGAAATALYKLSKAVVGLGKDSVKAFGEIEAIKTNLSVVYGSEAQSNEAFNNIAAYAVKSPFGVKQVSEFAVLLKQSGVYSSDLLDTLKMIGDVAGGNAEKYSRIANNYAQIVAAGKATSLDLRQFANAGLPIYQEIRKELGISQKEVRELTRNGEISAEVIKKVFKNMTGEGGVFNNAVLRGAETYKAKIQNLADSKQLAFSEIGEWVYNIGGNKDNQNSYFKGVLSSLDNLYNFLQKDFQVTNNKNRLDRIESKLATEKTLLKLFNVENEKAKIQGVYGNKKLLEETERSAAGQKVKIIEDNLQENINASNDIYRLQKEYDKYKDLGDEKSAKALADYVEQLYGSTIDRNTRSFYSAMDNISNMLMANGLGYIPGAILNSISTYKLAFKKGGQGDIEKYQNEYNALSEYEKNLAAKDVSQSFVNKAFDYQESNQGRKYSSKTQKDKFQEVYKNTEEYKTDQLVKKIRDVEKIQSLIQEEEFYGFDKYEKEFQSLKEKIDLDNNPFVKGVDRFKWMSDMKNDGKNADYILDKLADKFENGEKIDFTSENLVNDTDAAKRTKFAIANNKFLADRGKSILQEYAKDDKEKSKIFSQLFNLFDYISSQSSVANTEKDWDDINKAIKDYSSIVSKLGNDKSVDFFYKLLSSNEFNLTQNVNQKVLDKEVQRSFQPLWERLFQNVLNIGQEELLDIGKENRGQLALDKYQQNQRRSENKSMFSAMLKENISLEQMTGNDTLSQSIDYNSLAQKELDKYKTNIKLGDIDNLISVRSSEKEILQGLFDKKSETISDKERFSDITNRILENRDKITLPEFSIDKELEDFTDRIKNYSNEINSFELKNKREELFPDNIKIVDSIRTLDSTLRDNDWLINRLIDEAKMMNDGILVTNDDGSINQKTTNENYKNFALSASDYSTSSITKAYAETLKQGQQAFVELLSKGLFEKEEYKNLTSDELASRLGYGSSNVLEEKLNAFGLSLEDNKEGFRNFKNETLDSVSALQKFNKNLLETADVIAHWKGVEESNRIETQKAQLEDDLATGKYDSFFNIVKNKDESIEQAKRRMKSTLLSDISSNEVQAKAKALNKTPLEYITGLMGAYKDTNGLKNADPLVKKLNRFSYDQSKTTQTEFAKDRINASNTYLQTRLNKGDVNYNSDIADFYNSNFRNGFSKIEDIDSAINELSKLYTTEYENIAKLKERQKIDAKSLSESEKKQLSAGETKLATYQSEIDKVKTYKTTDYLKDDLSKSDDMMYQLWNFIAALTSAPKEKKKHIDTNNFRPLWERFTTQTLGVPAEVLKALNSSTGSYAKANGKKTNKADAELYAGQFFRAKSIREENTSLAKVMLSAGMSPVEMASMISRQNKTVGKANFNKKTSVDQEGTNATFRQYAYGKDSNIEVTKTLITSLNSQIEKMDSFFAGAAFQMEDASMVFEEAFKNKENYEVLQQAWKQLGYSQNDFSQLKDDINAFGLNVVESNENVKKFTEQLPNYLNELKKNTEELKKSTERIAALKTVFNEIKTNTTKNREEQKNIIYQYSGSYKETGREEFDNASFSIQKSIVESLKKALDSQDSLKKEADKKTAGNGFSTEMVLDLIRTYGTTLELYIEKADLIEKEISEKYGNNSNNNFINLAPVKEEIELGRTAVGLLERIEINTRGKSNRSSIPRAETAPSPINLSSSNPQKENLKGLKSRGYFDEIYDKWADEYKKTGTVSKAGYNQYINSEYNAKDFAEALVKRSNLKGDINPEIVKAGLNFGSSKLDLRYLKGEYQNNINYLSLFDKDFNKQTKVETAPNVNKNPEKSKAYEGTSLVTEKELEVATSFARALTEQGKTTVQPSQRLFNNTSSDSIFSRSTTLGLESNGDVVTDKFSTLRFNFKDPSSFFSGSTIINPFANGTERLDGTNIDRHAFKYSALNEGNNRQRAIRNRIAANYLSDNIKGFEDFSKKDDTFFSNTEEVESSLAQNIKEIMTNGSDKEKKSLQDYAQKLGINLYDKSDFNIISSQLLEDTKNGNLSNELLWNTQKEERALDSFKENDKTGFFKDNNIETSEQFVQQIETLQNSLNPEDQQVLASLGESYGVDFSKYKDDAEGFKDALFDARENMDLLNFAGDKLTGVIGSMKGTIKDGLLNGLNESLVNIGEMVYNAESFSDICDALKSQWKAIASQMMQSIGAEVTNTGLAIATAGAKSVANGNAGGWGMVAAGLALAASGGIMSFTAGILKGTGKKEDDKSKDEETKIENLKDALSDLIDQAKTDAEYYQKNLLHKNALSANESVSSRSVRSVNDAIITPNGSVVTTHPDDYLIATKTPGSLINAGKSDSSFAPQITFTVINASGQNVQLGETESETDDDGNINIKATIIAVTGEAIASGELDEAFSAMQYRQKGIGSVMG